MSLNFEEKKKKETEEEEEGGGGGGREWEHRTVLGGEVNTI